MYMQGSTASVKKDYENIDKHRCGLFNWTPQFLQKFKNPKCFVFFFCLILLFKDSSGIILILTKIQITDKIMTSNFEYQMISAISNFGAIPVFFIAPFVDFFPKKTVWIFIGILICASGLLITALPGMASTSPDPKTAYNIMLAGYFTFGLGSTTATFLAIAYIDNNSDKSISPILIGITMAAMILAQVLGAGVAHIIKVNYKSGDEVDSVLDQPWWAGFFINAAGQFLLAPLIVLFPTRMSVEVEEDQDDRPEIIATYRNYGQQLRRVLTTPIFVLSLLAYILCMAVTMGFRTNLMALVEHVYNRDDADPLVSLSVGLLIGCSALTMAAAAWVITRCRFQVKTKRLIFHSEQ